MARMGGYRSWRELLEAGRTEEAAADAGQLIAGLDLGASKAACLIGRTDGEGRFGLIGVGVQKPQSGEDGAPVDFDACVRAVRIAVDQAERMAGETITSIAAAYGGPGVRSQRVSAAISVPGGVVGPREARTAISAALRTAQYEGRTILHAIPAGYRLDEGGYVSDPRGMEAQRLSVDVMVVTAPEAAVAALTDCINEAGLRVSRVVAGPYAAGLAVLSPEERKMGAVALDLGAAHVGIAAFAGGGLVLADVAKAGGAALTADIAERLRTSFAAAERVKIVHGGLNPMAAHDLVEAPRIGPDGRLEAAQIAPAALTEAMGPRIEAMFDKIRRKLDPVVRWEGEKPWRAALCGGGSGLHGLRDLAPVLLSRPARLARPIGFGVLDEAAGAAAFAVAAGLLRFQAENAADAAASAVPEARETRAMVPPLAAGRIGGAVGRAWGWLKENF